MTVPIENIYYLLCYAWDHLESCDLIPTGTDFGDRIENLFAHVLDNGATRLLRQGLDHGYVDEEREIVGVRGKLAVGDSVKRMLLPHGRTACRVDEFTADVPHNRIIKAALRHLAAMDAVDLKLRKVLRRHQERFSKVVDIALEPAAFRSVQLHRNIARYGFLLNVCDLLSRSLLPDPKTGEKRFHPFTANQQEMGALFENFVRSFLKREQSQLEVSRDKVPWDASADPSALAWLPEMRLDILLASPTRRVVVETKFYADPYQRRYDTQKLRSEHLYQLLAYLRHIDVRPGPKPSGILLYAGAAETHDLRYQIAGFPVRVETLDLGQPWPKIRRDLLAKVASPGE